MMASHWGEMPSLPDTDPGIAAIEREQMTKPRPMEVEGPRLHQPSARHYPPTSDPLPAEQFAIDPLMVHTIRLLQHAKRLKIMTVSIQQQRDSMSPAELEGISFPSPSPVPDCDSFGCHRKDNGNTPLPFLPKDTESDFSRGIGNAPLEIDSMTCRMLLRNSVAAICAHAGYETCPESVLETLTDVSHDYVTRLTKLLRTSKDNECLHGYTGFQDIIQQVFFEVGIGSISNLHEFYQTRVVNYHNNMLLVCQQLTEDYEKVKQPITDSEIGEEEKTKVKDESFADIHFPSSEPESDDNTESDQPLQLESFHSLDTSSDQADETGSLHQEEEGKWTQNIKSEPSDIKPIVLDDSDSQHPDDNPHTPGGHIEADDSLEDSSAAGSDIMSPPSGPGRSRPKKKRKR
ncbi:STAGA complex 65 subunit gamma-like [Lingula anatina]|uniref:STAGA complex 65 subunit gamma n=1 Tax=Lingula anatina TaxID=7574 RepID=A0A1S3HWY9_LINAN|nr:STAGA complex 65 subunit gamma-like [Lingula anatina]|eukprot:XP_013390533.1 STAGA complex 65 subunit gamma-like [Lingula anatina]